LSWRYLAVAIDAVLRAGAIQKSRYGTEIEVDYKGTINLVTEVDHACEQTIIETIRESFEDHDIVTEERIIDRRGSRFVWYCDPLDGTTNYAHGYPCFCSSVAVARDGEVVAGAIYDPLLEELYTAEKGGGSYCSGRRMQVSKTSALIDSLLVTGFPYDIHRNTRERLRYFDYVMSVAHAVRRDGAAALDLCYVAGGRMDGYWEEKLQSWDMAAGRLMVEEAGGRVSRYDGSILSLEPDEIVATNGVIHEALLGALRDAVKTGDTI
jgi:myo-inositol-1(or 4)-monophosphatase